MKAVRIFLYILIAAAGLFIIFRAFATIDDYKPAQVESVFSDDRPDTLSDSARLSLLNWNIGYCGLDRSMDFFYDGGKQMRPSRDGVAENMKGVLNTLSPYHSFDFILLQEVDLDSKRSYHFNMQEIFGQHFQDHLSFFGMNYNVAFVPIPVKEPMGKVESGLLTFTKFKPQSVDRFSFPGNYSWPMGVFMLDRCFLVNRYPVSSGNSQPAEAGPQGADNKELVLINTHNSAYDDGSLRKQQMDYLKGILLEEYEKGNYVVVGGDWNQTPYGMQPGLPDHPFDTINLTYIEKDYPAPGWTWAFDPTVPTNRRVTTPYNEETTLTTVIDCYLLSPNILLEHIKTVDVDFTYSDHQPVELVIQLQSHPDKTSENENF